MAVGEHRQSTRSDDAEDRKALERQKKLAEHARHPFQINLERKEMECEICTNSSITVEPFRLGVKDPYIFACPGCTRFLVENQSKQKGLA